MEIISLNNGEKTENNVRKLLLGKSVILMLVENYK